MACGLFEGAGPNARIDDLPVTVGSPSVVAGPGCEPAKRCRRRRRSLANASRLDRGRGRHLAKESSCPEGPVHKMKDRSQPDPCVSFRDTAARSPPRCSCPRSLHDAPENALPWPWTDTAVRRMRLDQGPLHSPEDAE